MTREKRSIEERLEQLEKEWNWAKPVITALAEQLNLSKPRVNPLRFCRDNIDKKIINYLIDNLGAGATEIARAVNLPNPEKTGRHVVGKRLVRMQRQAANEGWNILTFDPATKEHPITKQKKMRAWWINLEEVDVEAFKRTV